MKEKRKRIGKGPDQNDELRLRDDGGGNSPSPERPVVLRALVVDADDAATVAPVTAAALEAGGAMLVGAAEGISGVCFSDLCATFGLVVLARSPAEVSGPTLDPGKASMSNMRPKGMSLSSL